MLPIDTTPAIPPQDQPWLDAPRPALVRTADPARPCGATLAEGLAALRRAHRASAAMHDAWQRDDHAGVVFWGAEAMAALKRAGDLHHEAHGGRRIPGSARL
jgi:hypothetical protein